MDRITAGVALALGLSAAGLGIAQERPRPKADFEAKAGKARPAERGARWEHPQPTKRTAEPIRMEPKKDIRTRSDSKDNWDRGRVADRVYPDVKWSGGQHTRRFNDAAKPSSAPDAGKGEQKGASAPPAAPAPRPRPPAPRP